MFWGAGAGMAMGLENIRIVLLSPLYGGNVGAVCRAMANMGLSDLVMAAPRGIDMDEARKMACHATAILDSIREFPTLAEAVADCAIVMGTTARGGLYRQHTRSPREWAPRALEAAQANRVALLFGPEDNGLSNEDLALCTQIITIPSSSSYESLNVSQAVLVCAYELFVASGGYEPPQEKAPEANSALRERMFAMWQEMLLKVGFMEPDKADHMMLGVRRIFARGPLTTDDVRILMGVARQVTWVAGQSPAAPTPAPLTEMEKRV
ncbi:MAG: RNA methyltransferase [Lentisphaerae bacterium]|nr:RNA methyltransferase [Lentisphaerota bacterium]